MTWSGSDWEVDKSKDPVTIQESLGQYFGLQGEAIMVRTEQDNDGNTVYVAISSGALYHLATVGSSAIAQGQSGQVSVTIDGTATTFYATDVVLPPGNSNIKFASGAKVFVQYSVSDKKWQIVGGTQTLVQPLKSIGYTKSEHKIQGIPIPFFYARVRLDDPNAD